MERDTGNIMPPEPGDKLILLRIRDIDFERLTGRGIEILNGCLQLVEQPEPPGRGRGPVYGMRLVSR